MVAIVMRVMVDTSDNSSDMRKESHGGYSKESHGR